MSGAKDILSCTYMLSLMCRLRPGLSSWVRTESRLPDNGRMQMPPTIRPKSLLE
jgi:hypothetical protein